MQLNQPNRPQGKRQGDWYCPSCGNFNFSFRVKCNRCQQHWRDDPQTQQFQKSQTHETLTYWKQSTLPPVFKLDSENSITGTPSTGTLSDEEEEYSIQTTKTKSPFQQALFVHDLLVDEPPLNSTEFPFYRECSLCKGSCYFYQSKCSNCLSLGT